MTSAVEDRLKQAGVVLPDVPAPVAVYVPAVRVGNLVFTSGQLPVVGGALQAVGVVGDDEGSISPEQAADMARVCAANALAAIKRELTDLDRVTSVVKVVGFVASRPEFTGQSAVLNGASELLGTAFGDRGRHARSAVGVAALPLGAPVEVEIVVEAA